MKKNEKKALLLAGIASLCILCGCKNNEVIETEDGTYIEQNGEYVKLNLDSKVFEPGTHIIQYNQYITSSVYSSYDGWGKTHIEFPEVPEGYRYVETLTIDEGGYGHLNDLIHIYVNVVPVEVTPVYNPGTGMVEYNMPGKVVDEKKLELGD